MDFPDPRKFLIAGAINYAAGNGLVLRQPMLGAGIHGIVFAASSQEEFGRRAIKVHQHEPGYVRERDVYLRLRDAGVATVGECSVPTLIRFDDDALVIEMTIVARPFVLDFAGAWLDTSPEFSEEVAADTGAEQRERFGDDFERMQRILRALEAYGIYMLDVNPGNIAF